MRVLVLGGSGMLGHQLVREWGTRFDTHATFRSSGVNAEDFDSVRRAIDHARPDVMVNCIGIVKQDPAAKDPARMNAINAEFPHRLAEIGVRLIHLSTDCVFSGARGNYSERDTPDPCDLYGRTKLAGEVTAPHCLTIRTSMIGRELRTKNGLVEWFLGHCLSSTVRGWTRAIFSGFTTIAMARIIGDIVEKHRDLHGLYHVAAAPIAKYDLLTMLNDAFDCRAEIVPDDSVVLDRSLDASRFNAATGFRPPSWQEMISEMADADR